MKRTIFTIILLLTIAPTASADYVFIWPRDDTGMTARKDRGVAKRGEVVSITPDTAPPSEHEKKHFLVIKTRPLTQTQRDRLLEQWGDPVEDRKNWKGKRRLMNVDQIKTDFTHGKDTGLVTGERPPAAVLRRMADRPQIIAPVSYNDLEQYIRLKDETDLARYRGLVRTRYAGRVIEYMLDRFDPTRKAYAETITTICPTSCTYTTIDNWETTEGGGGTLTEIKTGNIKDDDGVVDCNSGQIDGQTTSASNYMRLYSSAGERHAGSETDGSSGNGSLLNHNGGGYCVQANDEYTRLEWLQIKGNGSTHNQAISNGTTGGSNTYANIIVRDLIYDRAVFRNYNSHGIYVNILAYDNTGGSGDACMEAEQGSAAVEVYNATFHNCGERGFERNNVGSTLEVYNSISIGAASIDFESDLTTVDQNISGDATACDSGGVSGTDCIESVSATDIWEDPSNHDYTPKSGSDLIDFGNDYGTSPALVEVDLKGRDRDAEGDTWDTGAIELVAGGGPINIRRVILMTRRTLWGNRFSSR